MNSGRYPVALPGGSVKLSKLLAPPVSATPCRHAGYTQSAAAGHTGCDSTDERPAPPIPDQPTATGATPTPCMTQRCTLLPPSAPLLLLLKAPVDDSVHSSL